MSPAIENLLETINADLAMACRDGMELGELIGLAGAITESILKHIEPEDRAKHWNAMVKIMNRRFEAGIL